ncbi:DegV family protein [Bengtsoniella intestinalis]|uniref:DegV family protein n=1 Tax=Bengtsoniella intestinalis TaxID=3073143 RepID=UPI00391F56C2
MVTIMTDSSCMMTIQEGLELGILVNPLTVTIDGSTYLDLEEMDSDTFLGIIDQGHIPISSQPSIGRTLELYEAHRDRPILNLTIAEGLSGTYGTATGAVAALDGDHAEIRVVNTKTIWANQSYLVKQALELAKENLNIDGILEKLRPALENHISYLIPSDFDYLKRGGRLAPFAATVGGLLHLMPVLHHSTDGMRLEKFAMSRGLKNAVHTSIKGLQNAGINSAHLLSISHGGAPHLADEAYAMLKKAFPDVEINIHPLSPGMITQGGPKCIAIQSILKIG